MTSLKLPALVAVFCFLFFLGARGWGYDGHYAVCKIAQSRLSKPASDTVARLLPRHIGGNFTSLCIWADRVKSRYLWSPSLHFINTPDHLCTYKYSRDCKDEDGEKGRCLTGAINNYTTQLLGQGSSRHRYNLSEALLFLSHFIGDIHQPLHVGFTTDKGGSNIDVHWYSRKQVLHNVWDESIILTAEERYYRSHIQGLITTIQQNISSAWADQVKEWESCSSGQAPCPDTYATESVKAACDWAYKGVSEGAALDDNYFLSRVPVVYQRLAQAGVRLAATLNRIFT
ncbi:hypothetical protein MLD38_017499 [Melastoma candidum]|uniref:Uncharacterized protein n=1 Tax=Melastoma candidum TaxID=119954 RepID=A0ACB9QUB6_9MYRT|nr:hypothetical protein MLD38_017499 [Melastoma candidum]